ncbi:MAG: cation:proton antiporter [Chloroflexota bacterium]|nr:cation:proton antiporter [Chloroflexota bacterium]
MEESRLILDLAIAFGAALGGGLIARSLRQPALLGYLIAGIVIGPYALGLVQSKDNIEILAAIGVVLLLFTLGVEFSFHELKRIRNVAIFGGIAQIAVTTVLGMFVGISLLGQSLYEAIVFGFMVALSSTMVVVGMLVDRGEANSVHGRVMIGILLLQDIAAAFAMFILPTLGTGDASLLPTLGVAFLKAGIFIALVLVTGIWVIPRILRRVALRQSRELCIIAVAALCLGGAFAAYYFGLSAALGAFAIGLMIGQSDFAHQAVGNIAPLRDLFAALFFVSIGMLIDLQFLAANIIPLLILVAAITFGKFAICSGITHIFGYRGKTVPLVGAGMMQIGEFSFVLAQLCLGAGAITNYTYSMILGGAFVTIVLTPFVFSLTSKVCIKRRKAIQVASGGKEQLVMETPNLTNHVIICGHGRVGGNVARLLSQLAIPYVAIDLDPKTISELREQGIPCVYGDGGNQKVLYEAGITHAAVLALAIPDPAATRLALDHAELMNANIDIIARTHSNSEFEFLQSRGISGIVQPETEASIEILRHILCRLNMPEAEIEEIIASRRKICPM